MTELELAHRLAKFKKRVPLVTSRQHFDKIIESFPEEHRTLAIDSVSGILRTNLKELPVVEVKVKDEANVSAAEATAIRLNTQAAKIIEQSDTMAEMSKRIQDLEKENKTLRESKGL